MSLSSRLVKRKVRLFLVRIRFLVDFVYVRDSEDLMNDVNQLVRTTINSLQEAHVNKWNVMKQSIKESVGQFLYAQTKRRPMILPIIIEV